jgi:hypothetical protein
MPRPRPDDEEELTEDAEFQTDIDTEGNVIRRMVGTTVRPRVIGGRRVPGTASYYRRRGQELLADRTARQRREARNARDRARRAERRAAQATQAAAATSTAARTGRRAGGTARSVSRAAQGQRTRRG